MINHTHIGCHRLLILNVWNICKHWFNLAYINMLHILDRRSRFSRDVLGEKRLRTKYSIAGSATGVRGLLACKWWFYFFRKGRGPNPIESSLPINHQSSIHETELLYHTNYCPSKAIVHTICVSIGCSCSVVNNILPSI
jgi:hypothetical protein